MGEKRSRMDEWRKKENKMKERREIGEVREVSVGQARSASETRWRKRKNLSAGHKEWRSEE